MRSYFIQNRFFISLLVICILYVSANSSVSAGIISTTEIIAEQQSTLDREDLLSSLDREEVKMVLMHQGVDIEMAKIRVAGMTDEEVRQMNAKMDEMPAASGFVGAVVFVMVVLLVTDLIGVTDVYSFIN